MNINALSEKISEHTNSVLEYRTNFFRDRSRIIHSASFRRLQGKTQVLGLGDSDFYRTRLTHSLEVASLSQSIIKYIKTFIINSNPSESLTENDLSNIKELISVEDYEYLLEAIGLAHDMGHPPFGHGGERALHQLMKEYGGFEGNAQTMRILTQLAEYENSYGMNPSLRLILGVLKYPISYTSANKNKDGGNKPPKCIYDDDRAVIYEALIKKIPQNDVDLFFSIQEKHDDPKEDAISPLKYNLSKHKSFDCYVMELADDISYAVHDLEDGVALNLLKQKHFSVDELQSLFDESPEKLKSKIHEYKDAHDFISKLCGGNRERKRCINTLIYLLINSIAIKSKNEFTASIFKYKPFLSEWAFELKNFFFDLVKKHIILSPEVKHLEKKGEYIINQLFNALTENPEDLLEIKDREKIKQAPTQKHRIICDYIAGMTDNYASKIYKRLYIPDSGSVFDRL